MGKFNLPSAMVPPPDWRRLVAGGDYASRLTLRRSGNILRLLRLSGPRATMVPVPPPATLVCVTPHDHGVTPHTYGVFWHTCVFYYTLTQ